MSEQELVVGVGGMTCGHCEASVRDALSRLTGVTAVEADREAAGVRRDARVLGRIVQSEDRDIGARRHSTEA